MERKLLNNINDIHTTKLGVERIKKNLLINDNVIEFIKNIILDKKTIIYQKGKNYYCENNNYVITINSNNYCVITAHKIGN